MSEDAGLARRRKTVRRRFVVAAVLVCVVAVILLGVVAKRGYLGPRLTHEDAVTRCRAAHLSRFYTFLEDEWTQRRSSHEKSIYNAEAGRVDRVPLEPQNGLLPDSLADVLKCQGETAFCFLLCPGRFRDPRAEAVEAHLADGGYGPSNADKWMDYIYVPWTNGLSVPAEYPLVYDRRLSNHEGGINVLNAGGQVFWDENAQWLKQFAKDHPQLKIPLPEDIANSNQ